MLLGLMADVHCNVEAFNRAMAEMAPVVDEIVLLGDAVYEYRFSNDVVGAARQLGLRYIQGNHEMVLLGPHGERARSAATVDPANVAYLRDLPMRMDVRLDGKLVCLVHGSPWPPHNEYLYPQSPTLSRCPELGVDILLLAHTHIPMVKRVGQTLVVNPGSLGESRDPSGDRRVSYALLDTSSEEVEVRRMPNPRFPPPGHRA